MWKLSSFHAATEWKEIIFSYFRNLKEAKRKSARISEIFSSEVRRRKTSIVCDVKTFRRSVWLHPIPNVAKAKKAIELMFRINIFVLLIFLIHIFNYTIRRAKNLFKKEKKKLSASIAHSRQTGERGNHEKVNVKREL